MSTRILVPLDGSPLSERVFPLLRLLADRLPSPVGVELVRCYEPPSEQYLISDLTLLPAVPTETTPSLASLLDEYLDKRKALLPDLKVSTRTEVGEAASGILARAEHSDLILMASHGRSGLGRWLLGSVAYKVARGATIPVLVVGAQALEEAPSEPVEIKRILVGLDGSPCADRALQRAADMAYHLRAELLLYRGVRLTTAVHEMVARANQEKLEAARVYLEERAAALRDLVPVEIEVREAGSSAGIVECAGDTGVDLVVVGSHGRSGLVRWAVGSQTDHALHYSPCPVLVTH